MSNMPTTPTPYRFYLGPVGFLRMLPPLPPGGVVSTPNLIAGEQENMAGGLFTHILGAKRTWVLSWEYLNQGDFEFLRAAQHELQVKPNRLVDQRQRNKLSEEVASGGTLLRRTNQFVVSSGSLIWRSLAVTGLESVLGGGLEWVAPLNGTLSLPLSERAPLHADWASYTLSCYVAGTGTARIQAIQQDGAGANPSTTNGAAVALTPAFQRLSVTAAYVAGKALMDFSLQATVAGTMQITGLQLQTTSLSAWVPGGGCPEVKVKDVKEAYIRPGQFGTAATIREV